MTSVRAERGAAFLDERVPGWADLIDLDTLDLDNACNCVVGQLEHRLHPRRRHATFMRFDRGLLDLGVSDAEARRLGFYGRQHGAEGRTWPKLIRERQTGGEHA